MRAQARLDHARNGQAAKQAARDAAATKKADVEEELQVGGGGAVCLPSCLPGWLGVDEMQPRSSFALSMISGHLGCTSSAAASRLHARRMPPAVPLPHPWSPSPSLRPLQAAKHFAEHFAAVWERKERESGLAAQQLHLLLLLPLLRLLLPSSLQCAQP